jgi:hypothetical protein
VNRGNARPLMSLELMSLENRGYSAATNLQAILTLEVQSREKLYVTGPIGSRQ